MGGSFLRGRSCGPDCPGDSFGFCSETVFELGPSASAPSRQIVTDFYSSSVPVISPSLEIASLSGVWCAASCGGSLGSSKLVLLSGVSGSSLPGTIVPCMWVPNPYFPLMGPGWVRFEVNGMSSFVAISTSVWGFNSGAMPRTWGPVTFTDFGRRRTPLAGDSPTSAVSAFQLDATARD